MKIIQTIFMVKMYMDFVVKCDIHPIMVKHYVLINAQF